MKHAIAPRQSWRYFFSGQDFFDDADLVVVGKNRVSTLADFLFGGFAQRLLSWATSDVLVVPHDHQTSSRAAANLRIKAELGDGRGSLSVVQRKTL